MAENKEEFILKFDVQQGDAINELERTRLSIIRLKEQQTELAKAYKTGNITQKEYAQELVRVEALLKKESAAYGNLQKSVTGVQTQIDKLTKSNKELSKSLQDQVKETSVAGVSIGQLTQKVTALANPVSAAAAVVAALGAAYISSAAGARDLESATVKLRSTYQLAGNDIARALGADGKGGGLLSRLASQANFTVFGTAAGIRGELVASAQNQLKELELVEIASKRAAKTALDEAEKFRRIRDDETKTQAEREEAGLSVADEITKREQILVEVQEKKLGLYKILLAQDEHNLDLQKTIKQIEFEIADIKEDSQGKRTEAIKGEQAIAKAVRDAANAERDKAKAAAATASELERQARIAQRERDILGLSAQTPLEALAKETAAEVKITTDANDALAKTYELLSKRVEAANEKQKKSAEGVMDANDAQRDALRLFSSEAGRLYQTINEDQARFAALQLALDAGLTLSSITKNAATLGPVAGPIYFAAALLSAGASLAAAAKLMGTSFGFFGAPVTGSSGSFTDTSGNRYEVVDGEPVQVDSNGRRVPQTGIGRALSRLGNWGRELRAAHRKSRKRVLGFAEGGYTGDGGVLEPAGTVHRGEYVSPQHVVSNPAAAPHLAALESLRQQGYADGGFVRPPLDSGNSGLIEALRSMQLAVGVVETTKALQRHNMKMQYVNK